ncbi:sex determination protein tasselseed-2 [Russula emetica]|nr:sex determination protein tasselseed-2 [Russula emetica]
MAPGKQAESTSPQEHHKHTVVRLARIQSHLTTAPRTGKLKGKVAIITGVGSLKGIGRASALSFAHEGAQHLYLMDLSRENLPNLKSTIDERYPDVTVTVIQADASDDKAISDVCQQALREQGRLDIFFANAGVGSSRTLEETSGEMFTNIMRVNALSCFLAVKHASAAMKQTNEARGKSLGGGSIVLTASIAGIRSGAGPTDCESDTWATSRNSRVLTRLSRQCKQSGVRTHASLFTLSPTHINLVYPSVNSIAQTAAWQLQRTDIRVNALCPGLIETGMTSPVFDRARQRGTANKVGQLNPMGRYGVAEEIANAALFLASGP